MKRLIALCILFGLVFPVIGQTVDPASTLFEPLAVSNLRLQLSEDNGASLIFNASPTVCEPLFVDVTVDGQFIDVNAFAPPTDAVCTTVAPYEPVIALPELATDQAYIIAVNTIVSRFYLTSPETEQSDEAFAVLWGVDTPLIPFDWMPSAIGTVDFTGQAADLSITVSGSHPDGCETDEFIRLHQDEANTSLYHAEVFRLVPQGVMCPAVLLDYSLTTSLALADGSIIEANSDFTRLEDGRPVAVEKQAIEIALVEILNTGTGTMVVVSGDHTSECVIEPQSSVVERDYVSLIEIFAFASDESECTDDAPFFTDAYFVDVLPVIVNGVAYDENGIVEPIASGQGGGAITPEGNFMQADTVIESVEVAVLESSPMQLQLTVSGFQPDGCDFPVEIEQTVDGNTVSLHIFRTVPVDVMCPAILNPYEETIMVDGTFEGGTVDIQVNDFETSVDL